MYKAIFWDNDGVLVNTEPLYFESTKKVLAEVDVELTMDYYINQNLKYSRSCFNLARDKGFSEEEIQQIRQKRNVLYADMLRKNVIVMDGVRETLENLHGKVMMGIVTSSCKFHLDIILDSNGLRKYFDFIVTIDDVKKGKPDPDAYLLALKKSSHKSENCLVIEDTERGVEAAKAANLSCFAIPNELSKSNNFSKADKILKSTREVPRLVLNI